MAILKNSARLIFAGGFAVAITIAPVVATFAGPIAPPAARTIADPNNNNCTVNQTKGSVSLACAPGVVAGPGLGNVGAPSESDLTNQNTTRGH